MSHEHYLNRVEIKSERETEMAKDKNRSREVEGVLWRQTARKKPKERINQERETEREVCLERRKS